MINYYLITKPGIVMGNLVTVMAGFLLASKGEFQVFLFLETLVGLALVMSSGCVFNNFIDLSIDRKMNRTSKRPLVTGKISSRNALLYGSLLLFLGNIVLMPTNFLTVLIANVGFFVYVVLYSLWKGKTIYGTAIGSIAGAIPPIVGYVAVSNRLDAGAWILFMMLVFWQMPHFFSIALVHFEDYKRANLPLLPIVKGITRTKIHMVLYVICFLMASSLLTFYGYTGKFYLIAACILGGAWLISSIKGFKAHENKLWAKHMFRLSLVVITALSIVIPFDTLS